MSKVATRAAALMGKSGSVQNAKPPRAYSWSEVRHAFGKAAKKQGEYAGVPIPVEEAALVIAPGHPRYQGLHGMRAGHPRETETPADDALKLVNSWPRRNPVQHDVYVMREGDGRVELGFNVTGNPVQRLGSMVKVLGIALTMDLEAERRAMATLAGLIKPHLHKAYEMTGMFLETSRRSGVTYIFRRLATTLAIRANPETEEHNFLAALCLHPLGYYEALPIGVMVPTDDVIAHLVLMRSDEHFFWKKCNQHMADSPGAML